MKLKRSSQLAKREKKFREVVNGSTLCFKKVKSRRK